MNIFASRVSSYSSKFKAKETSQSSKQGQWSLGMFKDIGLCEKKICKRYTDITASNDFPNDDIHKKLSYRGKGKAKKKWISIRFYLTAH